MHPKWELARWEMTRSAKKLEIALSLVEVPNGPGVKSAVVRNESELKVRTVVAGIR